MKRHIREAMRTGTFSPMGGSGKVVEADDTYIRRKDGTVVRRGYAHKRAVVSIVERAGKVRSFHIDHATKVSDQPIARADIARGSRLMTDEFGVCANMSRALAEHLSVVHSAGQYARGDAHTNMVEGFFSIFKRGLKSIYPHCGESDLHRYLAEFDFRYGGRSAFGIDDLSRMNTTLAGSAGKRLTYRRISAREAV